MRRYMFLALPALAVACLLSIVEPSYAQRWGYRGYGGYGNRGGYGYGGYGYGGYGYGGYGYRGGWGVGIGSPYYGGYSPYYGGYGYRGAPVYVDGASSYQSFYPQTDGSAQGQGNQIQPNQAGIHVRVRPDAQVLFDNTPTEQRGPDRVFMTGPLDSGKSYTYTITTRWTENGQERSDTRTVRLQLGRMIDVDFTAPALAPAPAQIR